MARAGPTPTAPVIQLLRDRGADGGKKQASTSSGTSSIAKPTKTPKPGPTNNASPGRALAGGVVAAIAISIVVFFVAILACACLFGRWRRRRAAKAATKAVETKSIDDDSWSSPYGAAPPGPPPGGPVNMGGGMLMMPSGAGPHAPSPVVTDASFGSPRPAPPPPSSSSYDTGRAPEEPTSGGGQFVDVNLSGHEYGHEWRRPGTDAPPPPPPEHGGGPYAYQPPPMPPPGGPYGPRGELAA